ncbi:MAG: IS21 family transposase, partial [Patescibacteria group bacterium]
VFCNPASGNEKGNVENKVGYLRRNLLVPIPNFVDINAFNKRLLKECDEDHNRVHYEKNLLIKDLLQEQLLKNQKVNEIDFEVFRLEKRIVNKYGNIEFDTNSYSVNTSLRGTEVLVKIEANKLIILDSDYRKIIEHNRSFEKNQEIISYRESLDLIIKKINALENSQFYQKLPTVWKNFLKDKDKTQKRQYLKVLSKILIHDSLELATVVLQEAIKRSCLNVDSILTIYHNYLERDLIQETLKELPENTPLIDEYEINLGMYDKLMGGKRNEHSTL